MKTLSQHSIISCWWTLLLLAGFSTCAVGKDLEPSDLAGTWKLVYQESGGQKLPDEKAAEMFHGKMVFNGSEIRYTAELPGFDFKYSYSLHPDRQQTGIDLKVIWTSDGSGIGQTFVGICRRDGDTLEICYSVAKRPAEFVAAKGSDNVLVVLKRGSP